MVDRSGQLDERNSSNAQIRTLLEEQRQTIIAEYREKVGHHEVQAKQLTQKKSADSYMDKYGDRKLEFREAHQQSLAEMKELRKFQSFYLRYDRETKTHRGSENYFGIIRQSAGTAK